MDSYDTDCYFDGYKEIWFFFHDMLLDIIVNMIYWIYVSIWHNFQLYCRYKY